MHGVVLLDHFDARPTVLGDLVDIRAFQQAQADIGVAKAVGRTTVALAVEFQLAIRQHPIELLLVILREDEVGRLEFVISEVSPSI